MLSNIMPFKMHGNIYFVGSGRVSVHVIKTEVGLVMIDTGYPDMYDQIVESMEMVGLDPKDICAIFHSHGHIDHFGCTQKFKEISGAKTYISRIDNDIANGKRWDLSYANELKWPDAKPIDCDCLVEDGDCFTFGSTKIRCRLTPGHTEGVLSFFVHIQVDGEEVVAAMHGGVGRNTLKAEWLKAHGFSLDMRDRFIEGLHSVADEHVDFVLGNHPGQNNTLAKLEKVQRGESILNPDAWKHFLLSCEEAVKELIAKENAE